MKVYFGYCRVSTMKQSLERQAENIKKAFPEAVCIDEKFTGKTMDRPAWVHLMKDVDRRLAKGDEVTIIFDEVSRMSRNAAEGFSAYKDLYDKGVRLCFLKEPYLNTDLFRETQNAKIETVGNDIADMYIETTNRVLMLLAEKQIKAAFDSAEWERITKSKNTSDGVRRAIASGKQVGSKPGAKLTTKKSIQCKEIILKHSKDFGGSLSDPEVMQLTGLARNSYYKYKRELRAEQEQA